jgi:Cof subfamily protein (haloacid dehalogenase superfamily)
LIVDFAHDRLPAAYGCQTDKIGPVTSPIRLIAIDIDGTLLDSQFKIPAANISALRRAHELGVEIALVTGRRHSFALPIAEMLGFDVTLISSNGAVTRSLEGDHFHRDLLPAATARTLISHMDDFRGNAVVTFDIEAKGALVLERADELHHSISRWLEKNAPFLEYRIPLEDCLTTDPVQAMYCGTIARMREAENHLKSAGLEGKITVLKTEYLHRDLCMFDVLNYACSKGHAVERWAAHRQISRDQIMAIGDNYNDREMLEYAGMPVLMGNASEELKQLGWAITLSNDEGGVAAAVEQALGLKTANT